MAHVALDGRWLRVNQKLCDILGYSYEELTRQTFQDITYPPDLPEDLALLAKLQAGEINTYALEKRYIRRDGSLIWANLTVSLVSNADGSPDYFISVVEDISQRKQLEEIATTTALQLAGVLDVLPMGVIIADAEGRLIQSNQEADRIWGGNIPSVLDLAGNGTFTAWWPDGQPVPPAAWALACALRGETVRAQEIEIRTIDNERKTILNNSTPLRDSAGNITGAVVAFTDISQRRHLERRTHAALQTLLEMAETIALPASDEDAATHDGAQRVVEVVQQVFSGTYAGILLVDQSTEQITPLAVAGLSPKVEERWWNNLTGANMSDYLSPDLIERLHNGDIIELDLAAQPPIPGQDYFGLHRVLIAPATFNEHTWGALCIEARDQSGFSAQDRELAQAAMHLVTLVVERDRLLQERERARAHALALEVTRQQMNELLGIASHELRSPLTALLMSVQMAQMRMNRMLPALSDESRAAIGDQIAQVQDFMDRSVRQAKRMERLVGDLLDLTRIDVGSLALRPQECDLVQVVRDAVEEQRAAIPERCISVSLPPSPLLDRADPDRIGQVVSNFLSNALKYSAPDTGIEVRLHEEDHQAILEVEDHGPGLTPTQQEHLWDRFYRVPGITQHQGAPNSLGLGLYICRTIIERHNGHVGVRSTPGAGSTFWFALPLAHE